MKKLNIAAIILSIFLITNAFYTPPTALEQIQTAYASDMQGFEKTVKKLQNAAKATPLSIEQLQSDFKEARLAYKKIAWLIGYLEPENEKNFNGPPLTKLAPVGYVEVEPLGFQPIEEIIFGEDLAAEMPKLNQLLNDLLFYTQRWSEQMTTQPLSDREIFEAFRTELTQLFALSLTGFDSPVAFHSLLEARVAWANMATNFNFYASNLEKKDKSLSNSIKSLFQSGERYLVENQDFNAFDRLYFYKNFLNKIYTNVLQAQKTLGIEFYRLTGGRSRAWNDESNSIFDANFINPRYYSAPKQLDFAENAARIELGKLIFFDPIMSKNGKRSCASCHNPDKAFAENLAKSLDLEGKPVNRNAPSLNYCALATTQFWDGRSTSVENQMAHVASNPREMGNALEELPARFLKSAEYVTLFKNAFSNDTESVSVSNIEKSVGAYLRSLAGFNSEFDQYMRGEIPNVDPSVARGFNLFMGKAKCGTCHFAPVFNGSVPPFFGDTEFEVIGVPNEKNEHDADLGRYESTPAQKYRNAFKTVTVRNAALTAPYMHNGVYKTLDQVVDFYNKGGGNGMGFNIENQTLPFDKLNLSEKESRDIVRFMESLTDKKQATAPKKLPAFDDPSVSNRKIGGEY